MTASEHQPLDPRLMLLARAAARLTLFESGELDLDGACEGLIDMDWTFWRACDIADAKALIGDGVALQGNLDPAVLYATEEVIEQRVLEIAERMGDPTGHIFNLGHGVPPNSKLENTMPKMKTHKGVKKRFKVSARGKVRHKKMYSGHLLSHKSGDRRRAFRRSASIKGVDNKLELF